MNHHSHLKIFLTKKYIITSKVLMYETVSCSQGWQQTCYTVEDNLDSRSSCFHLPRANLFILSIIQQILFFLSWWWWCLCMVSFTCVSCTEKSMSGDSAAYLIFDKVFHALTHCKLPRVPGIALPCLSSTTIIIMPPCPAYFFYFLNYVGVQDVNAGPQACVENTLATKPSSTLCLLPFFDNLPV